ncbi:ferritin [Haliovirga abyssi]|uniref:Ferritin n=1 Tax=Haliovirga abyssi TaxID=2996794 RepID=A0AAU9DMH8_9FUSO|nr:ferritin [Haliovirga abyssi]BDU51222.1 ferritin [Haliovirga abyssi]
MNKRVEEVLNVQINREIYSSYLYLSMSAYFNATGLKGMANWTKIQYQEELSHAMKMFDYVNERGGRVILEQIERPAIEWTSPLDVFEGVLSHEEYITKNINELMSIATEEKDYATVNFLQWFVGEQVEEEANVNEILDQLNLIGDNKMGLVMLDKELVQRVFVDPTLNI